MSNLAKISLFFLLILRGPLTNAQSIEIQKIHPLNWYVGMNNPKIQLLIYGKNIADAQVTLTPYAGVSLEKVQKVENPNYLFLDLIVSKTAKAGDLSLVLTKNGQKTTRQYALKNRTAQPKGLDARDLIYLIMPDRFANGDPSNDRLKSMKDTACNRAEHSLRHGGDLQGITNHLDYLNELGVTALWLTPTIENDQPIGGSDGRVYSSYHGYAFTDHYQIDPRFGGNDGYLTFVKAAHDKGLKVVQDAVYNHCGSESWIFKDLPMRDWVNQWATYTGSNHRNQALIDPYSSKNDKKLMSDGWFVPTMPDMNQTNPYVANYLIQNAIWTTEYYGIDAFRIDTYMYCDLDFMNHCNQALMEEFPNIFMFGESWVETVANQAYFVKNNLNLPFKSNQLGGCDFQTYTAFKDALTQPVGWKTGVQKLYQTLSQDFLYQDPSRMVIFFENHDTDRFLAVLNDDLAKFKMSIAWLLTLRGIPQAYYGSEILMNKTKNRTDGDVREDFLGGWQEDKINKFTASGRTEKENDVFNYMKKLAQYRKQSAALTTGKMLQFAPKEGIYTYFRYTDNKTVMVVSNTNSKEMTVKTAEFAEILRGPKSAKNVLTDDVLTDISTLKIPSHTCWILEIM